MEVYEEDMSSLDQSISIPMFRMLDKSMSDPSNMQSETNSLYASIGEVQRDHSLSGLLKQPKREPTLVSDVPVVMLDSRE